MRFGLILKASVIHVFSHILVDVVERRRLATPLIKKVITKALVASENLLLVTGRVANEPHVVRPEKATLNAECGAAL